MVTLLCGGVMEILTQKVKKIEELFSSLNLTQLTSEPTNFTPGKRPSCIDLITTDQLNLVLNSGTRPSLDPRCHLVSLISPLK